VQLVESVITDLSKHHEGQFHVVRLSGFIHTDDKLALREVWRQLGKEMEVEDELVNKASRSASGISPPLLIVADHKPRRHHDVPACAAVAPFRDC
jgi:origin recognition complex subunit 4